MKVRKRKKNVESKKNRKLPNGNAQEEKSNIAGPDGQSSTAQRMIMLPRRLMEEPLQNPKRLHLSA